MLPASQAAAARSNKTVSGSTNSSYGPRLSSSSYSSQSSASSSASCSSSARVSMSARSPSAGGSGCPTAAVAAIGWSVSRNACRCGGDVARASARSIARSSSAEHAVSRCSTASQNAFNESWVSIAFLPTNTTCIYLSTSGEARTPQQDVHNCEVFIYLLGPYKCLKTRDVHTILLLLSA